MKVSKRKIWGLLGLFIVAAVTAFAALMPHPGASAVSANDTVKVTVVGDAPLVRFDSPAKESKFKKGENLQNVVLHYENIDSAIITLDYTNPKNQTTTYTIGTPSNLGQNKSGEWELPIDLDAYGYGHYVLRANATKGLANNITANAIDFTYFTDSMEGKDKDDNGDPWGDPWVKPPVIPGPDEQTDVECVDIHVWDENGRELPELFKRMCQPNIKDYIIPFDEFNEPEGQYNIEVQSFNKNGDLLKDEWYDFYYTPNTKPSVTPDENGNPQVTPSGKADAQCMDVHVYDANGHEYPQLHYEDCTPPFEKFTLPFDKYPEIPDGVYDIVVDYWDNENHDNPLGQEHFVFDYKNGHRKNPGITGEDSNGNPWVHPGGRENAQCMVVEVHDADGNIVEGLTHTDCDPPFEDFVLPFDQVQPPLPDGKYQIEVHYYDENGDEIQPPESYEFDYERKTPGVSDTDDKGNPQVHPGGNADAQCMKVHVVDQHGNTVPGLYYEDCEPPFEDFTLYFSEHNVPDGDYKIEIEYYDEAGNLVGSESFDFHFTNTSRKNTFLGIPNTGGLFAGLNLSRSDYLITGLVVFVIAAGGAAFIIYRKKYSRKNSSRRRH